MERASDLSKVTGSVLGIETQDGLTVGSFILLIKPVPFMGAAAAEGGVMIGKQPGRSTSRLEEPSLSSLN